MDQIKYLIHAFLILCLGLVLYVFIKPITSVPFIVAEEESNFYCGTSSFTNSDAPTTNLKGKTLFQQNCQTCHSLDKNLTGPALRGFTERGPWGKKENIYKWIHNPTAFMKKDKYTQDLKAQYGVVMLAFPQLTIEQIDAIVEYVTNCLIIKGIQLSEVLVTHCQ